MSAMKPRLSAPSTVLDRRAQRATEQELDGLRHRDLGLAISRGDELVYDRQVARHGIAYLKGRLPARRAALNAHRDGTHAGDVDLVHDGACLEPRHGRAVRHREDLPCN